jgi:hypothetical protein
MDPISAVSFATSIVTFIDLASKVVSGTFEVLGSGKVSENAHVAAVVDDLTTATKQFVNPPPAYSKHAESLAALVVECQNIAEDLRKLLETLKVKAGSSRWKSIKIVLLSMRRSGEVAHLEDRLGKCRSQILFRLVLLLK